MSKTSDQFLDAVDDICGGRGDVNHITDKGDPRSVLVSSYRDVPEPGYLTSFTFGLSSADHAAWKHGRPELMLSVRSDDDSWGLSMGEIVRNHRDQTLFEQGSILKFGRRISSESLMSSYLVFASNLLDAPDARFDLGDRIVNVSQLYPIHEVETETINKLGVKRFFWEMEIEFENVRRSPMTIS